MLNDETSPQGLAAKRADLGLSQQAIADHLGVKLRTWQSWEYGERPPQYPKMLVRAIRDLEREIAEAT